MNTVQIKDERYLQRELSSKAILNTNKSEITRYREQTAAIERNKLQLSEFALLKQKVDKIEGLLEAILFKL
jgi:hypothetical protein